MNSKLDLIRMNFLIKRISVSLKLDQKSAITYLVALLGSRFSPCRLFFISLYFFQVDGGYRKTWDDYIVNLDIVDSDKSTNTELIHWITRCPYPFATREYIYLRRRKVRNLCLI